MLPEPLKRKHKMAKNQPRAGLTVDSSQLAFLLSSKSHDTKSKTNIKIRPDHI